MQKPMLALMVAWVASAAVEVLEPVGGVAAPGTVKLGGEQWSAFTDDGSLLKAGERALVVRIDGLKLCIRAAPAAAAEASDDWKRRTP